MLKKLLPRLLVAIFLFNASGLDIFAAEASSIVAAKTSSNASKQTQQPAPLNSFTQNITDKERFKLFEPARYGFLAEDKPVMLPSNESATQEDEYFNYSRAYMENIIAQSEGGIQIKERATEYIEILNPSLLLPVYGTTISLTGRKTFGLKYDSKKYDKTSTTTNQSYSDLVFEQELQMKVQGKISDRIFVDIDYDDQRTDAQNIGVAYRGKGEEIVQSADFGDIELSLPSTQFLSYSKQVFGAKMHLKYGGANLFLIGSQTKGESKTKQFKGDSVFDTVNIKDINYIRRTYYDLTFDGNWTSAIVNGTAEVYLDDHTNTGYQIATKAVDYATCKVYPADDGTSAFRLLTNGVDYTVDTNKNILIFTRALSTTDVVAINFRSINGQWLNSRCASGYPVLVKTQNDRPLGDYGDGEISYNLEIKRYYNIGTTQLTRDDGSGNFILKLLESDGTAVCPATAAPAYCPSTNNVDYDKGIFYISGRFPDTSVYNQTPISSTNRYFFVQFNSTVRTYFLEQDVVVQSETVKVNGATMARNKDYYVDYSSGYITFYNRDLIGSNSVIDVSYEVKSESKDSSLLGGRFNYDFTKNISIGTSLIQEANSTPNTVPNIGDLSTSLTTMEADARVKDLEVLDGLKISAGGEVAQSQKNQNLFGYAMIESMEEVKEYIRASVIFSDWQIASNPTAGTSFFNTINWDSEQVRTLTINPNSVANSNDKQNVLVINYDFSNLPAAYSDRDEISIVYPISNYGVDFSTKTLLEFTMLGEENGPQINISFGTMNEASDNYDYIPPDFTTEQIFPVCSKYYVAGKNTVPKTEDLRCTGQLTASEDQGWLFVNPDGSYTRYNPFANNKYNPLPQPNGILDTQDLNANGILDSEDTTSGGSFGFADLTRPLVEGTDQQYISADGTINFTGWRTFQRELDFSAETDRWTSIQQMRITLKKSALGANKGTIKIANLAVSGSTWQPLDSDEKLLTSYGINNVDNPNYKPIYSDNGDGGEVFRTLYGSVADMERDANTNNILEQSLALQYQFEPTFPLIDDLSVQRNFSSMDFSQHKQFRFLLYNNGPSNENSIFYLRIATDDNNYSEVQIPLDFANQWRLYKLELIDLNGDHVPDRWENVSSYNATVTNEGSLNYKRVGIIKTGIRRDDANPSASGEVWLDDIFLAEAITSTGMAYEADAKIELENWFETGGKVKYMDDLFQTPVTVATNQKNRQDDYYFKFKRIKYLPIKATYYRSNTITPDVLDNTNTNTVSLLDQGEVKRDRGTLSTEYTNPKYPRVALNYSFENTDYSALERADDTKDYSASINYTPIEQNGIVKNVSANIGYKNNKINYDAGQLISSEGSTYNTDEKIQNYTFKMNINPWKGTNIVPSYSLTTADESRKFYDASVGVEQFRNKKYSKYATQNASINTSLRILPWLTPTASYTINIKENNNLSNTSYTANNVTYDFDIGDIKSINRNSEGNVGLSLNGKDILKKSKLVAGFTISGSYKMQDGDSWEYVDDDFNSLDKIWLRSSMGINSPYSYRSTLTLRDTYTTSTRWTPLKEYNFGGAAAPLNTLSLINNFSQAYQTSENLGAMYKTKNSTLPDTVLYIDDMEKFFSISPRYLSGTNLKLKYSMVKSETISSSLSETINYGGDFRFVFLNAFDTTISYTEKTTDKTDLVYNAPLATYLRKDFSVQTSFNYKKVRFTPKFTYILDRQEEVNNVLVTDVKEIVPSLAIKWDFNLPFGLNLPVTSRQYLITNRVIWTTNLSYSRRRSYTVEDNRDLIDLSTNLDYEVSKNIRFTLTGAYQRFKHLYIAENSYTAYSVGSVLTIQF